MTDKDRPLVDRSVFALAEHWMQDYDTIADRDDLTWECAGEIQRAIEAFFEAAESNGRLRES